MNVLTAQVKAKRNGGKIIMVGVPVKPDSVVYYRLNILLNKWANRPDVFVYRESTPFAALGRNLLIQFALKVPQITHILFVDSDEAPPDDTIDRLLAHDKDIVTAATPMVKEGKIGWNVMALGTKAMSYGAMDYDELPTDLFEIEGCGAGCMLVKREVFETMDWPHFKDVFDRKGWRQGQDIYFINKAKSLGFKAFCDPTIKCEHNKNNVDLLKLAELMRNSFSLGMNGYGTHLPILVSIAGLTEGPILELGAGVYSTPILHEMCVPKKRPITTCEQNPSWFKSVSKYQNDWHKMLLVDNWETCEVFNGQQWDVVFVDHNPSIRRHVDIRRLKNKAQYMVVHDTDNPGYQYEPVLGEFKYRYDYKKMEPWTTVVSNFNKLDFLKGE